MGSKGGVSLEAFEERCAKVCEQKLATRALINLAYYVVFGTIILFFVTTLLSNSSGALAPPAVAVFMALGATFLIVALLIWSKGRGPQYCLLLIEKCAVLRELEIIKTNPTFLYNRESQRSLSWLYAVLIVYVGGGLLLLWVGYSGSQWALIAALLSFTLGFYSYTNIRTLGRLAFIKALDESERPELHKIIESGKVLVPRQVTPGSCNTYMHFVPNRSISNPHQDTAKTRKTILQVAIEAAGSRIDGKKVRTQPTTGDWVEYFNCAFPTDGNYITNLKISLRGERSEQIVPISNIEYSTSVSSFFVQTLNPLILGVIPAIIAAIALLITTR